MEKSWREDPSTLIPMIQANVKYGNAPVKTYQSVKEITEKLITPKKSATRLQKRYEICSIFNNVFFVEK